MSCFYNQLSGRENTEWANFWYDYANKAFSQRCLMIGDSTGRQIRRSLSDSINMPVDFFGSSASLRDVFFWNQLDAFIKDSIYNKYNVAIIWIGNHSRISLSGGQFEEQDYARFAENFEKLLQYVQRICPNLIVLGSFNIVHSTGLHDLVHRLLHNLHIQIHSKINTEETKIVEAKNEIMRNVCTHYDTPFMDMNKMMSYTRFNRTDHIYFHNVSNKYQATIIRDFIKKHYTL